MTPFRVWTERNVLVALIALTIAKGMVWIAICPAWKIADEPAHFDNIQYRAQNRLRKPIWDGSPTERVMSSKAAYELRYAWNVTTNYYRTRFLPGTKTVPEEAE